MFGYKGKQESVHCGLMCIFENDELTTAQPHPVPLLSVNVTASVVHAVAQVEITQIYVNREEQPIEAVYYFPVDSNGAVTLFEAEVEGRKIKGIAKAHEEAKEQYEKAMEQKQTAFLAEENKLDIFKVRIGFLKPGSQAKIVIGYVTEVKNEKDSNAIGFFLPTTVAPRYVPQRCTNDKSQDLANMKFSQDSPAPMSIKVNVSIQGEIKSIDSPTHKITVCNIGPIPDKPIWTKASVELSATTTDMDRDFVLLITPEETHKPRLYLERTESTVAVMAHLIPSFKLDEQKVELIFVLDRSGSMEGQSITLAKKALTLFLHSLPMDCYFNIVGFGSHFKLLFPRSVKYDDGSLKKAKTHAKDLDADMGGTEIREPLKKIFSTPPIPGYLRQIFILTDGEVDNTDEVIGLTKANAHESRVFSLGIGDAASHHLVDGVAQAGGGTSAFVTYNEKIDTKVMQQLKDALQPSLTNVTISWHGVTPPETVAPPQLAVINRKKTLRGYGKKVEGEPVAKSLALTTTESTNAAKSYRQAPEKVPPIFDGSQLVVFGVFGSDIQKPTGATITAESPDGPLPIEILISEENDLGNTNLLHKLASIKIVREIELKLAALGFNKYDHYGKQKNKSQIAQEENYKKEIIAIAVAEGFASKYTSFVAVDSGNKSEASENWIMQTRFVPSQVAHGWHGGGSGNQGSGRQQLRTQPARRSAPCRVANPRAPARGGGKRSKMDDSASSSSSEEGEIITPTARDPLQEVVGFQSFNGSFSLDDSLIEAMSVKIGPVRMEASKQGWNLSGWATALALAFLSTKLAEQSDSWELVAAKAKKWLQKNCAASFERMLTAAKKLFASPVSAEDQFSRGRKRKAYVKHIMYIKQHAPIN